MKKQQQQHRQHRCRSIRPAPPLLFITFYFLLPLSSLYIPSIILKTLVYITTCSNFHDDKFSPPPSSYYASPFRAVHERQTQFKINLTRQRLINGPVYLFDDAQAGLQVKTATTSHPAARQQQVLGRRRHGPCCLSLCLHCANKKIKCAVNTLLIYKQRERKTFLVQSAFVDDDGSSASAIAPPSSRTRVDDI